MTPQAAKVEPTEALTVEKLCPALRPLKSDAEPPMVVCVKAPAVPKAVVLPASGAEADVTTVRPEPVEVLEALAAPPPFPVAVASAPAIPDPTAEELAVALATPGVVYEKLAPRVLGPPLAVAMA